MKYIVILFLPLLILSACEGPENRVSTDLINIAPSDENTMGDELPVLTFDTTLYEFGQIVEGQIVSHTYKFQNTGNAPLIISRVEPSCGCTTAEKWSTTPYLTGAKGEIAVNFDSNRRPGIQTKTILVMANTVPSVTILYLKGEVVGPQKH